MLQLWKVGLSASVEGLVFRRFGRLDLLQVWKGGPAAGLEFD
ncbi:hypothetical protein HMPREF1248_1192 [Coriobacteriaceae bacterium BV3Ac1]|nr:hypothetical protein HMPREF1248_1192 [Coriobacteriaceae bacterium BV3Ac1]